MKILTWDAAVKDGANEILTIIENTIYNSQLSGDEICVIKDVLAFLRKKYK
jgi:hypothetical protein